MLAASSMSVIRFDKRDASAVGSTFLVLESPCPTNDWFFRNRSIAKIQLAAVLFLDRHKTARGLFKRATLVFNTLTLTLN